MSEKLHPIEAGLLRWYAKAPALVDKTTAERINAFTTLVAEAVSRTGVTLRFPKDRFEIVDTRTGDTIANACWNGSGFSIGEKGDE